MNEIITQPAIAVIGVNVTYEGVTHVIRSDYSFATIPSRDIFDAIVKGINARTGQITYVHDYERGGICRCDNIIQGRGRLFSQYAEFASYNDKKMAEWFFNFFDQSTVIWDDSLKPVAEAYKVCAGDYLAPHASKRIEFDLMKSEILETLLKCFNHPRNKIKRYWIPSAGPLAAKRRNYEITFPMIRKLIIELHGKAYGES